MGDVFEGGDQRAKVAAMIRRDLAVAAIGLAFGAVALYESAKLPFGTVRNPAQGFFPWWTSVVIVLLAIVLLGQVLRSRSSTNQHAPGRIANVTALLLVLAAYTFLLDFLGYLICTFFLVLFMLRATNPHRWPVALSMAFLTAVGSYVVFAIWLSVPLPRGPL
jgi:putative tricarboxylic transport membrane protein